MEHPVVRFEIAAADMGAMKRLYRDLFGWSINDSNPIGYGFVETNAPDGIPGGIREAEDGTPRILFYVGTPSLDETLAKAVGLGCLVLVPRTEVTGVATFAHIADPEGNVIGLLEIPPASS